MKKIIIVITLLISCYLCSCGLEKDGRHEEKNNTETEKEENTYADSEVTPTIKPTPKPTIQDKEPYVGMAESEIQNTLLGRATKIEECNDFDMIDNNHRWKEYTWDFGGGKSLVALVFYDSGSGKVHSIEKYPKDPYGNTISSYW